MNTKSSTDFGWGCMLRSGQNILAETLKRHVYMKKLDSLKSFQESNENQQELVQKDQMENNKYNNSFFSPQKFYNEQHVDWKDRDQFEKKYQKYFEHIQKEVIQLFSDNVLPDKNQQEGSISLNEFYKNLYQQQVIQEQKEKSQKKQEKQQKIIQQQNNNQDLQEGEEQKENNNIENDKQTNNLVDKKINSEVFQVKMGIKDMGANYSIQRICYQAHYQFNMAPGEWYKPNRIMLVLEQLHRQNPYYMADDLEICSLNSDCPISYEKLLQLMCQNEHVKICENKEHIQEQQQQNMGGSGGSNYGNQGKFSLVCRKCHQFKKSLALYINTRIGLEEPQKEFIPQVFKLLNSKFCTGAIGGKGNQAHYFIGSLDDDKLVYLDPHTTQPAMTVENKEDEKILRSFSSQSLRVLKKEKLNPTLCFGFYIKDLQGLQKFYEFMGNSFPDNDCFITFVEKEMEYKELQLVGVDDDEELEIVV